MSMIFFCQSDKDLRRYGLKSIYDVGLMFPDEIAATLGFSGKLWSSALFCTLWDESWEMTRSYNNDKSAFAETPVYYFLNEVLDICDKAAFFYCEPMQDKTDWEIFKDKRSLLGALSRNFQKESYNDVFFITYLFEKKNIALIYYRQEARTAQFLPLILLPLTI